MDKKATTEYPIMAELESRWSPRAFDPGYNISQQELGSLVEAARWAPSSSNSQPWSFVVGVRGDQTFQTVFDTPRVGEPGVGGQRISADCQRRGDRKRRGEGA